MPISIHRELVDSGSSSVCVHSVQHVIYGGQSSGVWAAPTQPMNCRVKGLLTENDLALGFWGSSRLGKEILESFPPALLLKIRLNINGHSEALFESPRESISRRL